jgi:mycothiol synthase
VKAHDSNVHEATLVFWSPNPAAEAFARHHGFAHARWFWLMERPRGATPEVVIPDGVTLRTFDGSEAMLRDWNDAYVDSFAQHYHFVRTSVEDTRTLSQRPTVRAEGLALAYRDGSCVGFCRCNLLQRRGEIAVVGTTHDARRIGLGRALLRWGVRWLEAQNTPSVTLMVDGENEDALKLYRSEGFEVIRTRQSWSREP